MKPLGIVRFLARSFGVVEGFDGETGFHLSYMQWKTLAYWFPNKVPTLGSCFGQMSSLRTSGHIAGENFCLKNI